MKRGYSAGAPGQQKQSRLNNSTHGAGNVAPAIGAASFNCAARGGVMVTTPTAFVAVMAGVGDSPNSDFSDEHAERKGTTRWRAL